MGCADFCEWFVDLVIQSEESDPFNAGEEGAEALPVARTSNLSSDQGRFKRERMKQLFNRHGYNLAVFPGGNIKGKFDKARYSEEVFILIQRGTLCSVLFNV